jgi:hypothetical protein
MVSAVCCSTGLHPARGPIGANAPGRPARCASDRDDGGSCILDVDVAAGMPQTVFATFTLQRCAIRTRAVNVLNG